MGVRLHAGFIEPHSECSRIFATYYLEDTFILLDALEQDQGELQALRPSICLEIG